MNPLEFIQQYTSNITKSVVMLKQLGFNSFPLPSMEEVISIKQELLSIHPADIVAKLAWDDYTSKERFIRDSLNGFLEIDGCGYAVGIDGEVYDYWDGLTEKLIRHTEGWEEATAQKYVNDYSTLIWEISWIIHDTTRGMKADLNYLFNDEVEPEDSTEGLRLPEALNVPEASKYFQRCINEGWLEITPNGGNWKLEGIRLAYVCNKIYKERGYQRPQKELVKFFNDFNLKANLTTAEFDPKNSTAKRWREEIDKKIFFD